MVGILLPALATLISSIPGLYTAIVRSAATAKTVGAVKDVSAKAQEILQQYFNYKNEFNKSSLEIALKKLDATKAAELAKLEAQFQLEVQKLGYQGEIVDKELIRDRIELLKADIKTESFFQRGWRPTLMWAGTTMLILQAYVGLLLVLLAQYWPEFSPYAGVLMSYDMHRWDAIIMVSLGVGIASRSYEKVNKSN